MRFLYIAVAAALLSPIGLGAARADDACMGAIDGSTCPEDGDPCTIDRCASGSCTHVAVPDRSTCDPVLGAYQHTVGLDTLVGELQTQLAAMTLPETGRVFGETPHDFVTRLRMDTAKRLLVSGEMPVTDVCLEVGYTSLGTFSARFAAQVGRGPSEYRRQARRCVAPVCGWRVYRVPSCYMSMWQLPQF